ncbi:hypothetical protein DYI24_00890 [Rhodopseudomonas sp. BR0C11]|uniref:hypothetical protein n=1 Tax=Rhodopseudomonas sp. BR0C11 TaxID=2269370 RepID=UPI0013DE9B3E|nr:hypothetical protein [Rhodopseudomonas sp. BR0C11]NEV75627.1 hypothetical protein [Rhodopseudomonas sp. BR0C11]
MDLPELDNAARVNLREKDLRYYEKYKADLIASGETEEDIDLILRGFIWDATEGYDD